jgi:predicted transcriptional regulator
MTAIKYENRGNSIQEKIMKFVTKYPGIRYRELVRLTGVPHGSLSYHLKHLNNSRRIRIHRVNNLETRYFSHKISTYESNIVKLLRQNTTRKIIVYLLKHGPCGFKDIVIYTKKVPSTVSWHLSRLKDANIIEVEKQKERSYYEIKIDKLLLENLLNKYKSNLKKKIAFIRVMYHKFYLELFNFSIDEKNQ